MASEKDKLDWSAIRTAMTRLLTRNGIRENVADDLAQEALHKMLRGGDDRWSSLPQALAYAAKTTRSVLVDHFRRASTRTEASSSVVDPDDLLSKDDLSDRAIRDSIHLSLAMQKISAALPPAELEVLRAGNSSRGSLTELARARGVHRATVHREWRRVLRKLRLELLEMAEEDETLGAVLERRGYD